MAAAMIPIILTICTVLLGVVSGWRPFDSLSGVVVLGLFGFVVGGLVVLMSRLESPEPPTH
jgi:hypothetical protein